MSVVVDMAARKRPELMHLKPRGEVTGAVWCAILALDAPTLQTIAHWCGISTQQADKAVERLRGQGRVVGCGLVPIHGGGRRQTYRVVDA